MEKPPRPPEVKEAILAGDREALSAMGKKGAEIATKNRRMKKEEVQDQKNEFLAEAAAQERDLHPTSEEGNIIPPNEGPS